MRRPIHLVLPTCGVILATFLLFLCHVCYQDFPFTFHGRSICRRCGVLREFWRRQLPLTEVTYSEREVLRSTPLSEALEHLVAPGGHPHSWEFVRGAGNGIQ